MTPQPSWWIDLDRDAFAAEQARRQARMSGGHWRPPIPAHPRPVRGRLSRLGDEIAVAERVLNARSVVIR